MDFRVDFTSENILPDGSNFGYVGEHNAATLVITPPESMTDNAEIKYICLACEVGREFIKTVVRSEMYEKAATIRIPLWAQATVGESAKLQLEGYDGGENLLVKSELVNYTLSPSASGVQAATDMSGGSLAATVAKNSAKIEELALNGGGKVKRKFLPWNEDGGEGVFCFSGLADGSVEFYLSSVDSLPSNSTILAVNISWMGVEKTTFNLAEETIADVTVFERVPHRLTQSGMGTSEILTVFNAGNDLGQSLYAEGANENANGYIDGVYVYYFDETEEVE